MRVSELRTNRVITEKIQNADGTELTATLAELNKLDGVTATAAELNYAADLSAQASMAPAAGFLGTGTIYKSAVTRDGEFIKTQIYIDLTGAKSSTTDLDIIGNTGASHIGQILAAVNGTIVGGTMTCLEAPTGGVTDIDLYDATVATGAFDAGIEALTEAALLTAGDAWTLGEMKALTVAPGPNVYLYLVGGAAGTADTYTAGKFLIDLLGV